MGEVISIEGKYHKEVRQLLFDMLHDDMLTEEETNEIIDETLEETGITLSHLASQVEDTLKKQPEYSLQDVLGAIKQLLAQE